MTLLGLIRSEAGAGWPRLVAAATLSGAMNAVLLRLIRTPSTGQPDMMALALFAAGIVVYVVYTRYSQERSIALLESAVHGLKARIVRKIAEAELPGLERIGTAEIYDRVTENATSISTVAGSLVNLLQSLSALLFTGIYVASVSPAAFTLIALLVLVIAGIYKANEEEVFRHFSEIRGARVRFFDSLTDLLRGAKEVRFSRVRDREVRADLARHSHALARSSVRFNNLFDDNWVFASSGMYVLLAVLIIAVPVYESTVPGELVDLVACALFLWSPLSMAALTLPMYQRANHALATIGALEARLDAAVSADAVAVTGAEADALPERFAELTLRGVEYRYPADRGAHGFGIGPIDLTIAAGEVVFIVGGNGSGKSTLVKTLTGLYLPGAGELELDGVVVDAGNVADYRELFTTIFADFHLFGALYGGDLPDHAEVERLLVQMRLAGKTRLDGRTFTSVKLSTGQRKRLAMIVSLLEDRPIYVFDEWAADQDPEFRAYFYLTLIPTLRRRGKTVIAVSHDDRYFQCADRVVFMDEGRIRSNTRQTAS